MDFKKSKTPFTGSAWELWAPQMVLREKNIRSEKGGVGGIPSKIRGGNLHSILRPKGAYDEMGTTILNRLRMREGDLVISANHKLYYNGGIAQG